jgi:choline-glycine betaine transporter
MFVLVRNTSGIEYWLLTMLAVFFICYGDEVFVENQHVQNLAKYTEKNNLVNKKYLTTIIKQYMGNKIG